MPHRAAVAIPTAPTIADILLRIFMAVSGPVPAWGARGAPSPIPGHKSLPALLEAGIELAPADPRAAIRRDRALIASAGGRPTPVRIVVRRFRPRASRAMKPSVLVHGFYGLDVELAGLDDRTRVQDRFVGRVPDPEAI